MNDSAVLGSSLGYGLLVSVPFFACLLASELNRLTLTTPRPSVNYRTTHEDRNRCRPCASCANSIVGVSCRPSACHCGYHYSHCEGGKVGFCADSTITLANPFLQARFAWHPQGKGSCQEE